jgi:hypothetical protein
MSATGKMRGAAVSRHTPETRSHCTGIWAVVQMTAWGRLKIHGVFGPWVKFPGMDETMAEKMAVEMVTRLLCWWDIRAEYEIASVLPMEE